MKIRLLIITAFFLIGSNVAHAQLFGWQGSVTFYNAPTGNIEVYFTGPTFADCESERSMAKSFYSTTHLVVSETPCVPISINTDKFVLKEEIKIRLPKPVCLSCPYLTKDLVRLIYPQYEDKVIGLMNEFRIQEYNEALMKLNSQFDLEGFSKEMYFIENAIGR